MAEPVRFYLDEHVSPQVAYGLRRRGIDVLRAQEVGLRQAKDEAHLAFAVREKRVLVTQDADFLAMHKAKRILALPIANRVHAVLVK